jgi:quercetin dioxygenase-like cupin family protein
MTTTITEPTLRDRWFLGTLLRVLADGDDTAGTFTVMEQRAPKGFSPPLHVHRREDTALLVLEGNITVVVGRERMQVGSGGFVWLPRDVPHTFRVDSDTVRQLELITPSGVERFHVLASDPASSLDLPPAAPPDIPRLLAAAESYLLEMVGPPLGPAD